VPRSGDGSEVMIEVDGCLDVLSFYVLVIIWAWTWSQRLTNLITAPH
jgi:hypothetical protein